MCTTQPDRESECLVMVYSHLIHSTSETVARDFFCNSGHGGGGWSQAPVVIWICCRCARWSKLCLLNFRHMIKTGREIIIVPGVGGKEIFWEGWPSVHVQLLV